MLGEFIIENFRSVREMQTLSLVATGLASNADKYPEVDRRNIADAGAARVLKAIGLYGANASGKSNIVRALDCFSRAVAAPPSEESRLSEVADPFMFREGYQDSESFFQVTLYLNGDKYRYGFKVKRVPSGSESGFSKEVVTSEWLFGPKEKNQVKYFIRTGNQVQVPNLANPKSIPPLPYAHSLFLSHAAAFGDKICAEIQRYFRGRVRSNLQRGTESFRANSMLFFRQEERKRALLEFMSNFDLEYADIHAIDLESANDREPFPLEKVILSKAMPDGLVRQLNLEHNESRGTQKMFDLAGLFMMIFHLAQPGLVVLDELDSNFHPRLVVRLIELFNNPEVNRAGSQLLFTSHDTNLMNPGLMRRDQFYFTEKDSQLGTLLYSLADLKGIRNDADFARHYLSGFYGAVPQLKDFKATWDESAN